MSSKPVFISYSRKDSAFVNQFIDKLRNAGVNLWIDKNIKLGGRWDDSIETALESCDDVLVIASEHSMDSNNVMDEVSYALEENKRIIPIRIEDCEMNFRLRRIQHLDYFLDEEAAFKRLLGALHVEPKEAIQPEEVQKPKVEPVKEPIAPKPTPKATPKPEPVIAQPKAQKSNRSLIYVALVVIVAGIVYFAGDFEDSDDDDNENIINNDQPVNEELGNDTNVVTLTDQEAWDNIPVGSTKEDYENHMANYSDCVHVTTAKQIIKDFEEISFQQTTWQRATDKNDVDSYLNYIEDFGRDGVYYDDAIKQLETLFDGRGYVQFSESNGTPYFDIFETRSRTYPEEKDLIYALGQRRIRAGKLGTGAFDTVVYTTQVDEAYIVLEVEQRGTAYWVKVAF